MARLLCGILAIVLGLLGIVFTTLGLAGVEPRQGSSNDWFTVGLAWREDSPGRPQGRSARCWPTTSRSAWPPVAT